MLPLLWTIRPCVQPILLASAQPFEIDTTVVGTKYTLFRVEKMEEKEQMLIKKYWVLNPPFKYFDPYSVGYYVFDWSDSLGIVAL